MNLYKDDQTPANVLVNMFITLYTNITITYLLHSHPRNRMNQYKNDVSTAYADVLLFELIKLYIFVNLSLNCSPNLARSGFMEQDSAVVFFLIAISVCEKLYRSLSSIVIYITYTAGGAQLYC